MTDPKEHLREYASAKRAFAAERRKNAEDLRAASARSLFTGHSIQCSAWANEAAEADAIADSIEWALEELAGFEPDNDLPITKHYNRDAAP